MSGFLLYTAGTISLHDEELVFRSYVADTLQAIGKHSGGYIEKRYSELIEPVKPIKDPTQTVNDVLERAGIRVI